MSHSRQNSSSSEVQPRGRGIFPTKPRRIPPPHVNNDELEVMLSGSPSQSRSLSPTQRDRTTAFPTPSVPGTPTRLRGPRALPPSPQRTQSTDSRADLDDLRRRLEVVNVSRDSLASESGDAFGPHAQASPTSRFRTPGPIITSGPPERMISESPTRMHSHSRPASPLKSTGSANVFGPQPAMHAPRPEYPKQRPYLASTAFDIPPSPAPTQYHAGLGSPTRTTSTDSYAPPSPTRQLRTPSPAKRPQVFVATTCAPTLSREPSPTRQRIKVRVEAGQGMGPTFKQKLAAAKEATAAAYDAWVEAGYPSTGAVARAYSAAVEREELAQNELDVHNARSAMYQASYDE